jgi:hypothetical protein
MKDVFIVINETEYVEVDTLKDINFTVDIKKDSNNLILSRDNKSVDFDKDIAIKNYNGKKYVLLKETFEAFGIKYEYYGYKIKVQDNGLNLFLYYGNPAEKKAVRKGITKDEEHVKEIDIDKTNDADNTKDSISSTADLSDSSKGKRGSQEKTIEIMLKENVDAMIYQGNEYISKTFLEENGFLVHEKGNVTKITYNTKEHSVEIKHVLKSDKDPFYPLKELMDKIGIKYVYADNYFSIYLEDEEVKVGYSTIK